MSGGPGLMVALHVAGRRCLVVGDDGDPLVDERIARLERAGAVVERVSGEAFTPAHAAGAWLVLCHDAPRADEVTRSARAAGALAYAHDDPARSDLALPALAVRGALSLAISTGGRAPALARRLREELARLLDAAGPALDHFLDELEAARAAHPPGAPRRDTLRRLTERLRITGEIAVLPDGDDAAPSEVDPDPDPRR